MENYFFTSESVTRGHPDKVADQISDAILDECLRRDAFSKVACETMISKNLVVLGGEITTKGQLNYREIIQNVLADIGYSDPALGFDCNNFELVVSITEQSPDIAQGVVQGDNFHLGAGDQGMMFGYACGETPELMPLPIMLSHKITAKLQEYREKGTLKYLRPDAKSQVTVEYDEYHNPIRIDTIVVSTQHSDDVSHKTIEKDMKALVKEVIPEHFYSDEIKYHINPTGRFVLGGPAADCGLTGRKIIVDTYGGMAAHGGGCFSGKDPSKVDRSAAYAVRYVAKNVVAAGLASLCEVQIAYAIGVAEPVSIKIDTYGTSAADESIIKEAITEVFDLTPAGIIEMLDLRRPVYAETAYGGHFGRSGEAFTWERTDRVEELRDLVEKKLVGSDSLVGV
jgi:S-adenosylmethionine synthetase